MLSCRFLIKTSQLLFFLICVTVAKVHHRRLKGKNIFSPDLILTLLTEFIHVQRPTSTRKKWVWDGSQRRLQFHEPIISDLLQPLKTHLLQTPQPLKQLYSLDTKYSMQKLVGHILDFKNSIYLNVINVPFVFFFQIFCYLRFKIIIHLHLIFSMCH